jgi:uncharacterized membrane protein YozB (DUF420 family)
MQGFLGTRGDFIIDMVMTISGFLPFLLLFAFYLAARGKYNAHKYLQIILFITVTILVAALELDIHSGELPKISKLSPYSETKELMIIFVVHLFFAVSAFAGWFWLIVKSMIRYPKYFEFDHKRMGRFVFLNILMMAITGWILYWMTFAV